MLSLVLPLSSNSSHPHMIGFPSFLYFFSSSFGSLCSIKFSLDGYSFPKFPTLSTHSMFSHEMIRPNSKFSFLKRQWHLVIMQIQNEENDNSRVHICVILRDFFTWVSNYFLALCKLVVRLNVNSIHSCSKFFFFS